MILKINHLLQFTGLRDYLFQGEIKNHLLYIVSKLLITILVYVLLNSQHLINIHVCLPNRGARNIYKYLFDSLQHAEKDFTKII